MRGLPFSFWKNGRSKIEDKCNHWGMLPVVMFMEKNLKFDEDAFRIALATANKTQKQIAQECGVHELTITRLKKGADIKLSLALNMARALNTSIEKLWSPGE